MFENEARVLLILSQDVLDRARVFAGKATITLKLAVSLQIVLRALIEEGLRRDDHSALLANVEGQAKAVRQIRSVARRGGAEEERRTLRGGTPAGAERSGAPEAPEVNRAWERSSNKTTRKRERSMPDRRDDAER